MYSAKAQDLLTFTSKTQSANVELPFNGESRHSRSGTRKVSYVTPALIPRTRWYIKQEENTYTSSIPIEAESTFYTNLLNGFASTFQHAGKNIHIVMRNFQAFQGGSLEFLHHGDALSNRFIIRMKNDEEITLHSRCGSDFVTHTERNKSTVDIPTRCAIYSPKRLFARGVGIKKEKKEEEVIRITQNKIKERMNKTIHSWEEGLEQLSNRNTTLSRYITLGLYSITTQ